MGSVQVTGTALLPEHVVNATGEAVSVGLMAGCKHLREHGCWCQRAQAEISVAPDSQIRTGLEQSEKLSWVSQFFLIQAESLAWDQLQNIANQTRE